MATTTSHTQLEEMTSRPDAATRDYVFNQTMLRIRDPERSVVFYTEVLGMSLLKRFDFPEMKFSHFSMAYVRSGDEPVHRHQRSGRL